MLQATLPEIKLALSSKSRDLLSHVISECMQMRGRISETQHKIIETQHKVVKTQHKVLKTQHKIVETQHKIIETTQSCRNNTKYWRAARVSLGTRA